MSNHLPLFDYKDEALRHRVTVIPFRRTFAKDNEFKKKMHTPESKDALFTLMCDGARDALLKIQAFTMKFTQNCIPGKSQTIRCTKLLWKPWNIARIQRAGSPKTEGVLLKKMYGVFSTSGTKRNAHRRQMPK